MVLDFRHGFGLEKLHFSPTPAVSSSQHAWDPTNSACLSGVVSPVSQILGMKKSFSAFRDAVLLWFNTLCLRFNSDKTYEKILLSRHSKVWSNVADVEGGLQRSHQVQPLRVEARCSGLNQNLHLRM